MGARIPKMLERLLQIQLSLRTFITLCVAVGLTAGLLIRWQLLRPTYQTKRRTIDGFIVQALWVRRQGRDEFLYPLGIPDGVTSHGGASLAPDGVHADMNRSSKYPGRKYWIALKSGGAPNARPIDVDPSYPPLTPDQFSNLEQTALWKDFLRPALVFETVGFARPAVCPTTFHGLPLASSRSSG
jgi:hypothetical protein